MITSKLPHIGTTIFTQMSSLAYKVGAINLSQGFPNFPLDPNLKHIFEQQAQENVHQYAPMMGVLSLRETLVEIINKTYQRKLSPDNILITAGATQAIFTVIQALIHPNDEVILIDPAYDCYRPALDLVSATTHSIALTNNFELDLDKIEQKMNDKTRLFIINNPHNPSGTVFSKQQMDDLIVLLERHPNCLILSDEVYEFINFTNEKTSLNYYPSLLERLITVSSFGKSLHITGWKVGYLTANTTLMNEIKKVHQFVVFCVNHFAQCAINTYLKRFDLDQLSDFYREKRNFLLGYLSKSKLTPVKCRGTYFQTVDISGVTNMKDVDYAIWLTKNAGLASIPLSVFYATNPKTNYLRLCFAKDDETLTKAGEILCQI